MNPNKDAAARIRAELAQFQGTDTYDPDIKLPGSSVPGSEKTGQANPISDLLAERLTQQSAGISSSASSNLQASIEAAIAGTKKSGALSNEALQIERQREVGFAQDRASAQFTGAMESRTGYGTQVQALKELTETTEKSVRDLDQRYREAMLQNDAATAQRVADLQMEKLEFLETQEQNFYSNLFSLANLQEQEASRQQQATQFERGISVADQRLERQLGFDLDMFEKQTAAGEREQMRSLAAQYGVTIGENDTIDSMITKVSPFVDEKRRLELEAIRSDINASNARAAEAVSRTRQSGDFDSDFVDAYALAYLQGDTALMVGLEETGQAGPVLKRVQEMRQTSENRMKELAESSTNSQQFTEAVAADPDIMATPADVQRYQDLYEPEWREKGRASRGSGRTPSNLGTQAQQDLIRTGVSGSTGKLTTS